MSRATFWIGGVILAVSVSIMVGYGAYFFAEDVLGDSDVPLALRAAIPASIVGVLALLAAALAERLRNRKHEDLEGVEH
jgi:hypothetical protein